MVPLPTTYRINVAPAARRNKDRAAQIEAPRQSGGPLERPPATVARTPFTRFRIGRRSDGSAGLARARVSRVRPLEQQGHDDDDDDEGAEADRHVAVHVSPLGMWRFRNNGKPLGVPGAAAGRPIILRAYGKRVAPADSARRQRCPGSRALDLEGPTNIDEPGILGRAAAEPGQ